MVVSDLRTFLDARCWPQYWCCHDTSQMSHFCPTWHVTGSWENDAKSFSDQLIVDMLILVNLSAWHLWLGSHPPAGEQRRKDRRCCYRSSHSIPLTERVKEFTSWHLALSSRSHRPWRSWIASASCTWHHETYDVISVKTRTRIKQQVTIKLWINIRYWQFAAIILIDGFWWNFERDSEKKTRIFSLTDLVVMIGLQFCRSLVLTFRNIPAPPHLISPLSSLAVKCKMQSRCVSAWGVFICVIPRTNYDLSQCSALLATASLTVKMKVGQFLQF